MSQSKEMMNIIQQLEYNLNLKRRIIYLEGEIDTFSAPFILERVNAIRDYDPAKENEPINLYITSPGGDVNGLTALVDIIKSLTCPINTYGLGHVESAAVWILASGTGTRRLAPNTEVMVHEMSTWLRGTTSDVENEAKQLVTTQTNLYRLLASFTGKSEEFWSKLLRNNKNLYLKPEVCIEYGLADEIIKPNSL